MKIEKTGKKPNQTEKTKPNKKIEPNRFEPVSAFFFKFGLVTFFFIKTEPKRK